MSQTELTILERIPMGVDACLLRLERPDWEWQPGQLIGIQGKSDLDQRDYTIASGTRDETLDVLYRLIPHGILTPYLDGKQPRDRLEVVGPYGRFTLRDPTAPLLFCATGTGIAPCRAYYRSFRSLKMTLMHGVRTPEDLYFQDQWEGIRYMPFCSRTPFRGAKGRLTDALHDLPLESGLHVYLCGGNEMIYEAEDILLSRGVSQDHIYHEPYYYRAYDA